MTGNFPWEAKARFGDTVGLSGIRASLPFTGLLRLLTRTLRDLGWCREEAVIPGDTKDGGSVCIKEDAESRL